MGAHAQHPVGIGLRRASAPPRALVGCNRTRVGSSPSHIRHVAAPKAFPALSLNNLRDTGHWDLLRATVRSFRSNVGDRGAHTSVMSRQKLAVWPACDMSFARSSGAVADLAIAPLTPPATTRSAPLVAGRSSHSRSCGARWPATRGSSAGCCFFCCARSATESTAASDNASSECRHDARPHAAISGDRDVCCASVQGSATCAVQPFGQQRLKTNAQRVHKPTA